MRALLDTHVFLWLQTEPDRVGEALAVLSDLRTELLVSAASGWEIAIKHGLGKLPLPEPPARYVPARITAIRATPLPIELADALGVGELPGHHRDPFDRLLVAQAQRHELTLVTAGPALAAYDARVLRVP